MALETSETSKLATKLIHKMTRKMLLVTLMTSKWLKTPNQANYKQVTINMTKSKNPIHLHILTINQLSQVKFKSQ